MKVISEDLPLRASENMNGDEESLENMIHVRARYSTLIKKETEETPENIIESRRRAMTETILRKPDMRSGNVGFWSIESGEASSVARHYQDGMEIAVVCLEEYGKIVLFSHPKTNYNFEGQKGAETNNCEGVEIAGINFKGSVHSAGSMPNKRFSMETAIEVFNSIARDPERFIVIPPARKSRGGED
jgi:hypothetical protein